MRVKLLLVFSLIALLAAAVGIAYDFWTTEFPDVRRLRDQSPVVRYQGPKQRPRIEWMPGRPASWVTLGSISRVGWGAVLVSEDWAFFQHKGYDAKQMREAFIENLEEGRYARGASTLTQQVVKNVFLTSEKSLWRKLKELYLALRLEEKVGKKRILETYLNIAEWGEGIYGIGPASHRYFRKSPAELTAREGAFLAMLLPSPKRYAQSFRAGKLTRYASRTVHSILDKMAQAGFITPEERDVQQAVPLSFEIPSQPEPEEEPEVEETAEETTEE